ncbi:hypothetical protein PIB30_026285 [Stylosanthes scabra]|uniref:Uncharacterized protein n=1 Tax=Stylosanthes scabra TaxID=79078 RepID=A0ABU6U949_9FABA|nr:hypothetical protein [Stylosanthes scabra]
MARTKQTRRRTAREVPPPLPCLSNYAEEDWFEEDSEKKAYSEHLSRMHIILPRYVGDGAIPEDKYPEFWRLIDVQGLRQFLLQREGYYPRFVAAAFASVVVDDKIGEDGQGTFHLCVSFMGRTFNFPLARVAEAWGLRNKGTTFCGGSNPHSEWSEFEKMDAARALRLDPASSGKYHVSRMTTTHRLLLYVISQVDQLAVPDGAQVGRVLPRQGGVRDVQARIRHYLQEYQPDEAPREAGESSQSLPNFMEMMLKSFEALQARVDEGFAKITDRIDSIDISLISQAEEMRMLRDGFLELVGEVPPTVEPTAEAPTDTMPTAEVPSADPPVTDEATRTDDPVAEGTMEVAPVATDQAESVQAATETTEIARERSSEPPAHD